MSSFDIAYFIKAGKELGLEAKALREWAEQQLHDHKADVREKAELAKIEHERELEKAELAEKQHERELELIKEKAKLVNLDKKEASSKSHDTPRHRFPNFNDKTDDLDAFFQAFEYQAKLLNIDQSSELKSYLLSSLSGKARDIFNSLPFETDYKATKKVLLNKFNFTPNFYRRKFFNTCPFKEENVSCYIHRLSMYFDRWISLSETAQDFNSLRELIVKHTFLSSCNVKLSQFLLEKDLKKIDDLVTESERFLSAHESETLCKSEPFPLIANFSAKERGRKLHNAHSVEPDRHATNDHYRSRSVDNSKSSHPRSFNDQSFMHKNMNGKPGTKYVHNYKNPRKLAKNNIRCYKCSGFGHVASSCSSEFTTSFSSVFNWRERKDFPLNKPESLNAFSSLCSSNEHHIYNGLLGQENPKPIRVLRDTGSMVHAIHKDYVQDHEYLSDSITLITFGGNKEIFPLARIYVNTPFIKGFIIACVIENYPSNQKLYDVLIGNGTTPCSKQICLPTPDVIESWDIDHKHFFNHDCDVNVCTDDIESVNVTDTIDVQVPIPLLHSNQVTTRAQAKVTDPTMSSNQKLLNFDISDEEFGALQKNDPSLQRYFKHTISDDKVKDNLNHKRDSFVLRNGKLVRLSKSKNDIITQLVVPTILRNRILSLSHDTPICAHGGRNKTYFVLSQSFFWPGMYRDVKTFCKSCDTCQRTTQKGRNVKAPLQTPDSNNPRICLRPFEKIAIDIIGELPMSKHKNRFILTVIDYATRWTEAIPLKNCDTITISEALCTIFARFGFPREILSDNGPAFTSNVMDQVMCTLGIKHTFSTPYHPQTNGLCERVNATIKANLRKAAFGSIENWDRLLPITLFNIRSSPQETTKYTPFELLYGFTPQTLHSLIKDSWLGGDNEFDKPLEQYVMDLRARILKTCAEADNATLFQQNKSKERYDKSSNMRSLKVGDQVLLLLSKFNGKMEKQWQGPHDVIEVVSPVNYKINVNGKQRTFHINMLQKYCTRPETLDVDNDVYANVGIICDDIEDNQLTNIELPPMKCNETVRDVKINPELNNSDSTSIKQLLYKYDHVFSDLPGTTDCVEHHIELTNDKPIKLRPYPLPLLSHATVAEEVENMLKMNIIQESNSPYAAPIVLVKKKDGKNRFCIDYRKLNSITVRNATPIPDQDLMFSKLHIAKFFTKIDLTKGYWQVKMAKDSQKYTAFTTENGLYEFIKMPFGLTNCPATFHKLMYKLLHHRLDCLYFFDDVVIFHNNINDHVEALDEILNIFSINGLTIRPTKTEIAYNTVPFLGFLVGQGNLQPIDENVNKILTIVVPQTKKHVRSIIGLVNFYSKFIPHLATLLAPLSNLIVKERPDKVKWTDECQKSINMIQNIINNNPVLILPNMDKTFYVQTDASNIGIGAALLQSQDDTLRPCMYVSRKLLAREGNYATVEKECLAVVWALSKLSRFLLGSSFYIMTDHKALQFLRSAKSKNSRIFRWSLTLENFDYKIMYLPGNQNVLADFLSRNFSV